MRNRCGYVTESGVYRCTLPPGHTEWHKVEPNHSPRPADTNAGLHMRDGDKFVPAVEMPLSLAQRILAALVYDADGFGEHAALAAELRARVEGKA